MRLLERLGRAIVVLGVFGVASYFALHFGWGGLWTGLEAAHAVTSPGAPKAPYDLTQLTAVNETLNTIRNKYVDPSRVKPRHMFLSALNQIQKEVAQVIVHYDEKSSTATVQVETESSKFRVDNVQGPWDVAARLREVFVFLQTNLKDTSGVDLRDVEYAACNGMLRTLDPHSVFLSPDAYREMTLSTSGHFGGLGIVISIRDQQLTVMRPMPGTPAGRAGLRKLDRITKINNESTLNMPLDDAVSRLRGKPGSKVTVWLHRDGNEGWQGSRPFELTREEIQVRSIEARNLQPGIGYVRLKQFQASTSDELDDALTELGKKDRLRGLVLDLRGNPGGLLDQAAKVADRFLENGVIVTTVGSSEGRDEKRATAKGTEPNYPIVVLANESSASASEIVAGALKNQDRAIIVGQTTFGKGSVQLVFPRVTPDNAALKLTIAQYLTPGDVSIQGVGVSPDVELDPMTADNLEMDLFRSERSFRERDLSKSLSGPGARRSSEQPFFKLRYNLPESERAAIRERGGDVDDDFELDFPIKIGRDMAAKLTAGRRGEQLRQLKPAFDKWQQAEMESVSHDLSKLGVDWNAPPKDYAASIKAGDYEVKVQTDRTNDTVNAGESMALKVSVKNKGTSPVYQLRAITKSDGPYFDERELIFGRIDPGQTRTATVPFGFCDVDGRKPGSTKPTPENAPRVCKIPLDVDQRADVVLVRFFAESAEPPRDVELRPTINGLPKPIFAYTYQVVDNRPGNGDGQIARGEGATVYLTVKNVGKGPSLETQANMRNLTGDGLLLHAGRFDVSNMKPGDTRNVAFTFDVLDSLQENLVTVELSVGDRDLRVSSSEKLKLPVAKTPLSVQASSGKVTVTGPVAEVRGQPLGAAPSVGELEKGAVVVRLGTFGPFTKVSLGDDRFGFVETKLLRDATTPERVAFKPLLTHSPPLLEVTPAKLATRDTQVRIEGQAVDSDKVMDAFVFVGSRKVFYQSNRKAPDANKLKFGFDAELSPGVNVITVVARENEDTVTRNTMIVRRDGPNGEPLPTPKTEVMEDWEDGD